MTFRNILLVLAVSLLTFGLAACGDGDDNNNNNNSNDENNTNTGGEVNGEAENNNDSEEAVTLHLAALESAYGKEGWEKIIADYEALHDHVTVDLTIEKNLEEVIRPEMQADDYPDVFLLATDREEALTETMIKDDALVSLEDILGMDVPGEDANVGDKILDGFTDTLATNPYADGEMFLAPMFYSPTGLFYNAGLLEEKGWDIPETWDDMFELGEKAAEEDISLFTYPIAGYFDTLIGSMLYAAGGPDFFDEAMTYEEGIWESEEAMTVFETVEKLADYTHPNTVSNANPNDFVKNQQLILDNEALFMPSGTWIIEEMEDAPRSDDFEWGMMSVPAFEDGGDRYAFTFFEQIWIPSEAENVDAAKDFVAYMYSDEAADTFLEAGAVQPIEGIVDSLDGEKEVFYSIYEDEGALPAIGTFATTDPVPGANISEELYEKIDSVMGGKLSAEDWAKAVTDVSDQLRPALK